MTRLSVTCQSTVPRPAALALTAFARAEDRRRSLLAGYQAHWAKPFDLGELNPRGRRLGRRVSQGSRFALIRQYLDAVLHWSWAFNGTRRGRGERTVELRLSSETGTWAAR